MVNFIIGEILIYSMKFIKQLVVLIIFLLLFSPLVVLGVENDLDFRSHKGNAIGLLYDYLGKENIREHKQKKFMSFLMHGSLFLIFIAFLVFLMKSGISKKLKKFYSSKTKSEFLVIVFYFLTFLVPFYILSLSPNFLMKFVLGSQEDKIWFSEWFVKYSKFILFNGIQEGDSLQHIPAGIYAGFFNRLTLVNAFLNKCNQAFPSGLFHQLVTELKCFRKIMTGIYMHQGKRYPGRPERFPGQIIHDYRVFPTGEQQNGFLKLGSHFPDHIDGFGFQFPEVIEVIFFHWSIAGSHLK